MIACVVLAVVACRQSEKSPEQRAKQFNAKAVELVTAQKYDSALICLDSIERLDTASRMQVYSLRTSVYLSQKQYARALENVEKQLVLNPQPESMTTAGTLHDIMNDSVKAQECYMRALTMYNQLLNHTYNQQKILSYKVNRIYLLTQMGRKKEALQLIAEIEKDSRLSPEAVDRMKKFSRKELLQAFQE